MTHSLKIKVAHIITRLDAGGSSTNTIETVARLDKEKFDSVLIYGLTQDPDGKIAQHIDSKNISVKFIPDLQREIHPIKDLKAFYRLYFEIKKGRFDIVHTHTSKAGILGRWAAKFAKIPCIIHTPHGHVFYGYFNKILTKIFIEIEHLTAIITDRIITLTNIGKSEYVSFRIASPEKFIPIYSGIDVTKFENVPDRILTMKHSFRIPDDVVIVGTVTRLEPIKGNNILIAAFADLLKKHPHCCLIIIGEGPLKNELKNQARQLQISEKVIFTGFQSDITSWLYTFDVFVLASLNEGMGRVILEAMSCGKPIIASRTGGIPELIVDQKTGLLTPPGDVPALMLAMSILVQSKDIRQKFGDAGKMRIDKTFSIDMMMKQIESLYFELLAKKQRTRLR